MARAAETYRANKTSKQCKAIAAQRAGLIPRGMHRLVLKAMRNDIRRAAANRYVWSKQHG